jgi:hypothetical protein
MAPAKGLFLCLGILLWNMLKHLLTYAGIIRWIIIFASILQ